MDNKDLDINTGGLNTSNLKVICRIRPPKSYESQKDSRKLPHLQ